ncbi:unnamed protein product [Adineta steineri]|uniref:Uncharacterized protein n=1 Tax=Adineta steineri TaxID=433720 RepID=A0A819C4Y4_9BILA|nr:unnamed protein product [Adineta steineri]CAF3801948.1 unnamed protein product [Adineta steineri]
MDSRTVAQLTHILSEEAQMISDELRHNGHNVNPDMLVAKLDGLVTRMKYEMRNKSLDTSTYEFPIFNLSYGATSYPDPIDSIYDKHVNKAAYYPANKKNQRKSSTTEQKPKPIVKTRSNSSSYTTNLQPVRDVDEEEEEEAITDQYSKISHKSRRDASKVSCDEQSCSNNQSLRRSSTVGHPHSLSRSNTCRDLNSIQPSNSKKIIVNVISDDDPSLPKPIDCVKPAVSPIPTKCHKSILKSSNSYKCRELVPKKQLQITSTLPTTNESTHDLYSTASDRRSRPSERKASSDRVVSFERNDYKSSEKKRSRSRRDRLHTSKTHTTAPTSSSINSLAPLAAYTMEQPTYYKVPPSMYQLSKLYMPVVPNHYSTFPYIVNSNSYYPFVYYHY